MNRQALLLPLALLLLLCANLHLCCRVCIGGVWDSELYSLSSLLRAKHAAHETAEEICPHNARLPGIRERLVLSLQAPRGDSRRLSALILDRTPGVSPLYAVSAEGRSLGVVADRDKLEERLRAMLYALMPEGAARASFSPAVEITPVYSRSGRAMSPTDMALAVSGAVNALYFDRDGLPVQG